MKHNKIWTLLTVVSAVVLLASLVLGLYISYEISTQTDLMEKMEYSDADYHVMLLINNRDQAYGDAFMEGLLTTAKDQSVAVEIIEIGDEDYLNKVLDRLDMAMYAKVDGIILHAYNDPQIIDKINQASEMNIPVITLNENIHQSKRLAYIGSSRYSFGIEVGKTISRLTGDYAKVAVVDRAVLDVETDALDLLSLGIADVFVNKDGMTLVAARRTTEGVLSAENVAVGILRDFPDIDVIFSTDSVSTLGIVQVLIDQNKINDVMVIGASDQPAILSYIQTNAIDATMVTDHYAVGQGAIKTFYDYVTDGIVNSQITPALMVIDQNNVDTYLNQMEVEDENQ